MPRATAGSVLGAGLRGILLGVVVIAALQQMLAAWHDGALWHGLAALAVGLLYLLIEYRTLRASGRSAVDHPAADPS